MDVKAPAQSITAPAQLVTASAQPPAIGVVVHTALFWTTVDLTTVVKECTAVKTRRRHSRDHSGVQKWVIVFMEPFGFPSLRLIVMGI